MDSTVLIFFDHQDLLWFCVLIWLSGQLFLTSLSGPCVFCRLHSRDGERLGGWFAALTGNFSMVVIHLWDISSTCLGFWSGGAGPFCFTREYEAFLYWTLLSLVGGPMVFLMDWIRWYYILSVPATISQGHCVSVPTYEIVHGIGIPHHSLLRGTSLVQSPTEVCPSMLLFNPFFASRGPP